MTGDIVNFNRARKAKAHAQKQRRAEENRERFGESKAARLNREAEARKRNELLDGAKRESDERDNKP